MEELEAVTKPIRVALARERLMCEGQVWLTVRGFSMAPLFASGARLKVCRIDEVQSICRGDIVALGRDGRIVVHRILARKLLNGSAWILEGGDRGEGIGWAPTEAVWGRVESVAVDGRQVDLRSVRWLLLGRVFAIV